MELTCYRQGLQLLPLNSEALMKKYSEEWKEEGIEQQGHQVPGGVGLATQNSADRFPFCWRLLDWVGVIT